MEYIGQESWGMDPLFWGILRLYVQDILTLKRYPLGDTSETSLNVFSYKNHPIRSVDIQGIVVRVADGRNCIVYGVDDGTGVISCTCWKKDNSHIDVEQCSNLASPLKDKIISIVDGTTFDFENGYQLGDHVSIGGKIKVFRDEVQISATYHTALRDPSADVCRMLLLPKLYAQVYDVPFVLPAEADQQVTIPDGGAITEWEIVEHVSEAIIKHLTDNPSLHHVMSQELAKTDSVQDIFRQSRKALVISVRSDVEIVVSAMRNIEEQHGLVCRTTEMPSRYEVLIKENNLHKTITRMLQIEVYKPQYSIDGCHYMHLLKQVQNSVKYPTLHKTAFLYCLNNLEMNSIVIRTSEQYYTVI